VLLKVTVPKRRKKIRRTGDEGETTSKEEAKAAWARKSLPVKLMAIKVNYKVEAVGMIDKTVRFRGLFLTFCFRMNNVMTRSRYGKLPMELLTLQVCYENEGFITAGGLYVFTKAFEASVQGLQVCR
jgi:hypothetical protein